MSVEDELARTRWAIERQTTVLEIAAGQLSTPPEISPIGRMITVVLFALLFGAAVLLVWLYRHAGPAAYPSAWHLLGRLGDVAVWAAVLWFALIRPLRGRQRRRRAARQG